MAQRNLSKVVDKMILADSGLPWFAKGLEGQSINCGGCHHIAYAVRRYVARNHRIPNSEYFMFFDESHIKEFIYVDSR